MIPDKNKFDWQPMEDIHSYITYKNTVHDFILKNTFDPLQFISRNLNSNFHHTNVYYYYYYKL